MSKLTLMPVIEELAPLTPAVMYEVTAAKYVMLGIRDFRKLVESGIIHFRTHPGRTRRIHIKPPFLGDLVYLSRLPRSTMPVGEGSPGPPEKGA